MLYGLVRGLQPDVCVETGTAFAEVSVKIGLALARNGQGHLTTIELDPVRADDACILLKRRGLHRVVTVVTGDARAWESEIPIDFLFIDSSRNWLERVEELTRFYPLMKTGGTICLHDTKNDAYREAISQYGPSVHFPTPRGLTLMEVSR